MQLSREERKSSVTVRARNNRHYNEPRGYVLPVTKTTHTPDTLPDEHTKNNQIQRRRNSRRSQGHDKPTNDVLIRPYDERRKPNPQKLRSSQTRPSRLPLESRIPCPASPP